MILEVENEISRLQEAIGGALVDAAVQQPHGDEDERIVTTIVPDFGDGDIVWIEGAIDIRELARMVVEELGLGRNE